MKKLWDEYNENLESPDLYIDFGLWSLIAGAVGRKVWIGDERSKLFLNTYTIFVAPPAVGKSAVTDRILDLLFRLNIDGTYSKGEIQKYPDPSDLAVPSGPNCITKPKLVTLMASLGTASTYNSEPYLHASMMLCLREFSSLFGSGCDPKDVMRFLVDIYDCKPYQASTISRNTDTILNGCLTILCATQPAFMMQCFEDRLLQEGMGARTWFLWSKEPRKRKWDGPLVTESMESALIKLAKKVYNLSQLVGPLKYHPEALAYLKHWYEVDFEKSKTNHSPKLADYYGRLRVHVQKLAGLVALSEYQTLEEPISISHIQYAMSELERAVKNMDVALGSKSRNELFPVNTVVLDLLGIEDMPIAKIFAEVVEQVNARELVEIIRALMQFGKIRLVRKDGKIMVTRDLSQQSIPLLLAITHLKEFSQ